MFSHLSRNGMPFLPERSLASLFIERCSSSNPVPIWHQAQGNRIGQWRTAPSRRLKHVHGFQRWPFCSFFANPCRVDLAKHSQSKPNHPATLVSCPSCSIFQLPINVVHMRRACHGCAKLYRPTFGRIIHTDGPNIPHPLGVNFRISPYPSLVPSLISQI